MDQGSTHEEIHSLLTELRDSGFSDWETLESEMDDAYDRVSGVERVTITSAFPLSDSQVQQFTEKLPNTKIDWRLDPTLLAGVVIAYKDRCLDVSLKGSVRRLNNELRA